MRRSAPSIPNPPKSYPDPGSDAEAETFEETANLLMFAAMDAFGPQNVGGGIAALCEALGKGYRMLTNIPAFYGSPEAYADAIRTMVIDSAKDE